MGSNVLDLFSGTGSLGIESLSRNCNLVYFVDKSLQSINLIKYNTECLKDDSKKYKIIRSDVFEFLKFYEGLKWEIKSSLSRKFTDITQIVKDIFRNCAKKLATKVSLATSP
ncbi:unnamed protein product [marine sediment metagenome]|uniref:DNA methylase N-4/N-6 domain-containing protein n=1 Tax=marine sediment metagenome TaxID=412755 RepID=X1B4A9_9ZZZZ